MTPIQPSGSSDDKHALPARLSSSVILLRDTLSGPEVYVQERADSMQNYARMTVFPGGSMDERDRAGQLIDWQGPDTSWWAEHLNTSPDMARGLVCAAVRETFEETGTLFAGHHDGTMIANTGDYSRQREQLESHQLSLTDFLAGNDLVLRSDTLRPWANWITPEDHAHRFDLTYFVARMPEGQVTQSTREARSTGWFRPSTLLDGWRSRVIYLMPATWAQLKLLESFESVDEIMDFAGSITIEPVTTEPVSDPFMAEYYLLESRMYGTHERFFAPGMKFSVDPSAFPDNPFSHRE